MPYDCTTFPRESKSVGRCPIESGTLELSVCGVHAHDFGSSSEEGRFLCMSLTNMIRDPILRAGGSVAV